MLTVHSARPIAFAMAALFAVLVPIHLAALTGTARTVMPLLAASTTAALLGWLAFAYRAPARVTPAFCDALVLFPLVNSLTELAVTGDVRLTTALMLVFVAVGAGINSRRFALVVCIGGTVIWGGILSQLSSLGEGDVLHFSVQLAMSLLMAALLFETRGRREARLGDAQRQLLEHVGQLEAAQQELGLSERRFRSLFSDSPVGIGLIDENGLFVDVNAELCVLLGREPADLLGRTSSRFTHPDDVTAHSRALRHMARSETGILQVEKRFARPCGEELWAFLTVTRVDGPAGEPWMLAHVQDVTERKATEQALADSEANLGAVSAVVRRIRTGEDARQAITTAALELAGANSAAILEPRLSDSLVVTQAAGLPLEGPVVPLSSVSAAVRVFHSGQPLMMSDPASHPLASQALVEATAAKSALWQPVIAEGVVTGVLFVTWPFRVDSVNDRVVRAIELLADETAVALQHDQLLSRLAEMANTDALTGVANRRAWDEGLDQLMAQVREQGEPLSIAIVDLDHFKAFNDQHGHVHGDAVLASTARQFQSLLREGDLLARWGGEEFVLALPGADSAAARPLLERLRPVVTHGQTCSIGYATWNGRETAEQLLGRADTALYEAKSNGRDCSVAAVMPGIDRRRLPLGVATPPEPAGERQP